MVTNGPYCHASEARKPGHLSTSDSGEGDYPLKTAFYLRVPVKAINKSVNVEMLNFLKQGLILVMVIPYGG